MRIRITVKAAPVVLPKSGLFWYLVLLTAMFGLLEISYLIQSSRLYFGDYSFVASHMPIPFTAVSALLFFIVVQCVVHLIFATGVWVTARLSAYALNLQWKATQQWGFWLWGLGLVTMLLVNQYGFPNSRFAYLTGFLFSAKVAAVLVMMCLYLSLSALLLAGVGACLFVQEQRLRMPPALAGVLGVFGFIMGYSYFHTPAVVDVATAQKPNIIIIGVDALRPDRVGYFGSNQNTPYLDRFLKKATVFSQAYTPLARTFPAWVSLLTGQYPMHTGARFDLADQTHLDLTSALPAVLQAAGYETLYAMDETRFSNITPQFGFDHIITPPVGMNDFLVGSLNDFPLTNVLVNTALGKHLFPYSYANRPAYVTYDPNSFLHLLAPSLQVARTKPLFLAVHFCLPHYPYVWSRFAMTPTGNPLEQYLGSVQRADKQVQDFMGMLKQAGLLDHSIVVLLSDHGEALALDGDRVTQRRFFVAGSDNPKKMIPRFYPPTDYDEPVNRSAGHGTDVLGLTQYRILLAFKTTGMVANQAKQIATRVSLLDVKPTILALLGLPSKKDDGVSLRTDILSGTSSLARVKKDFFMESDFSPDAVRSVHPEMRRVLLEGIAYFEIDPKTLRFTVKKTMGDTIISSKQHADMYGDWMLALYPQAHHAAIPILVNLKTQRWTNDLDSRFAQQSPAEHMLQALKRFYGKEITYD